MHVCVGEVGRKRLSVKSMYVHVYARICTYMNVYESMMVSDTENAHFQYLRQSREAVTVRMTSHHDSDGVPLQCSTPLIRVEIQVMYNFYQLRLEPSSG